LLVASDYEELTDVRFYLFSRSLPLI
jgi:hypothetical protein